MTRARFALLVVPLLIAGCERPVAGDGDSQVDTNNPLEAVARARGLVRPEAEALTGAFERRHELGRDAMCVVDNGEDRWRFALTAAFGPGLSCQARGTIFRDGEGWRLVFAGAEGCEVAVREDEDELRFPGNLPSQCDYVCPNRASLAGLRLPRASWTETDAKRLRITDRRGKTTRPCDS